MTWREELRAWFSNLSLGLKIAVISLVLAVISAVIGVAAILAQVATPEIRCWIGLDDCLKKDAGPQPSSSPQSKPTAAPSTPDDPDPEGPPDPNQPYAGKPPAARRIPGTAPYAELAFYTITNRGKPVAVPLSGQGFSANAYVKLDMRMPDGSTYTAGGFDTDDRGLFRTSLLWFPLQDYGIEGNNGGWKIMLTDMTSGQKTARLLVVKSDANTPEPSQWERRAGLGKYIEGPPTINAGSSGTLCKGSGVKTETSGTGFTPGASLTLRYFRTDGQKIGQRGLTANGAGELDTVLDYWIVRSCASGIEFEYRFELSENGTDRKASGTVFLPSR